MKLLSQRTIIILTRRLYSVQASSAVVQDPLNFLDGHRVNPGNKDGEQKCDLIYPATGNASVICKLGRG